MNIYKKKIFEKLAQRKNTREDFKLGDICIFESDEEPRFNGYVLKIIQLNNDSAVTKIIETKDPIHFPVGEQLWPMYYKLKKDPPKPHVYSPVNMTGRYRTIGD